MNTYRKGAESEAIVKDALRAQGWIIVASNWRSRYGEIDIIAAKNAVLAFVEVKTIDAYGRESLSVSVNSRKQTKIIETSKLFVSTYREFSNAQCRYDVAAVRGKTLAYYYENAFSERT